MSSSDAVTTPLQRWMARYVNVDPRETSTVVAAFFLFFFVLNRVRKGTHHG